MNYAEIEIELKKRWDFPYKWGKKQDDNWDKLTNFIYTNTSFDSVSSAIEEKLSPLEVFESLKMYALNRWYNFHSAQAVEHIFCAHPLVKKNPDSKDKFRDFSIANIPFDHKTSVLPKGIKDKTILENKKELAKWLYTNQSEEGRFHKKNRIFLILEASNQEHWKLKAEILWLRDKICSYLDNFSEEQLISLSHKSGFLLTDIIWCSK